ncbi:MAG TPA: hypothetical protein VNN77_01400 [candidate division Zixibacteria bacterium]|nr:hypothetical protein [candidate division Zixibacteria bacterium]
MAVEISRSARSRLRRLRMLEKKYLGLRAKAAGLRRREFAVWRALDRLLQDRPGHWITLERRPGRKDRTISHRLPRGSRSLLALARSRGSSGLFCGCRVIVVKPQPNGDLDVCVLIGCSDDPKTSGFRCEYWCATFEAEPVVAIARSRRRRAR